MKRATCAQALSRGSFRAQSVREYHRRHRASRALFFFRTPGSIRGSNARAARALPKWVLCRTGEADLLADVDERRHESSVAWRAAVKDYGTDSGIWGVKFLRLEPVALDLGDVLVQVIAVALGVILGFAETAWNGHLHQQSLLRQTVATIVDELRSNQSGMRVVMDGTQALRRCSRSSPNGDGPRRESRCPMRAWCCGARTLKRTSRLESRGRSLKTIRGLRYSHTTNGTISRSSINSKRTPINANNDTTK